MDHLSSNKFSYALKRQISKTSNSTIWEAICHEDNLNYLIKESHNKTKLKNEFNTLIDIKNKNLIRNVEFFEFRDKAYLVQEYVESMNAEVFFKLFSGSTPLIRFKKALLVLKNILDVLSYLHSSNNHFNRILHGDIKPANILIGKNGKIYLIDFGSAVVYLNNENKLMISEEGTKEFSSEKLWVGGQYLAKNYNEIYELHSLYLTFLEMTNALNSEDYIFLSEDCDSFLSVLNEWKNNQNSNEPFDVFELTKKLNFYFVKYSYNDDLYSNSYSAPTETIRHTGNIELKDDLVKFDKELQVELKKLDLKYKFILIILSLVYFPIIYFINNDQVRNTLIAIFFFAQLIATISYFWKKQLKFKKVASQFYKLKFILFIKFKFKASKKLNAIKFILQKYDFNDAYLLKQQNVFEYMSRKAISKRVNLAIIGEFSSGKSTLINALIEYELLKTSPLPTTTISNKITFSRKRFIQVNKVKTYFNNSIEDLLTFIEKNTTENYLENKRVKIGIDSSFLKGNIDLIDTPGTNSGDEIHRKRALETIREEADFMLILIKATQPLTLSLKTYFKEVITNTDVKFAFVITNIDLIPKKERQSLIDDIEKRLNDFLDTSSFKIFTVSAIKKLDFDLDKNNLELKSYSDEFKDFSDQIAKLIHQSREEIIDSRIDSILESSISRINYSLEDRLLKLNERKLQFNEIVVKDIHIFKLEILKNFNRSLEIEIAELKNNLEFYFHNAKNEDYEKIKVEVAAINSDEIFNNYFGQFSLMLQSRLKLHLDNSVFLINDSLNFQKMSSEAEKIFWENYNQLKNFSKNFSNILVDIKIIINPNFAQELSSAYLELVSDFTGSLGAGAIAGAAIGTMILPGFGSIIGGVIGAVLGAISGPSLNEKKVKLINESRNIISKHYKNLHEKILEHLSLSVGSVKSDFEQRIDVLILKYLDEVEKVNTDIRKEKNELDKIELDIKNDLEKVKFLKME